MHWPSGENATELTESICPVNGPATISPVMAFHTQTVLSPEPETIVWPSGEKFTEVTLSVCPVIGPAITCYVTAGTFARRGLSSTAKTLRSPSGV